jgi:hypothetical protein
MSCSVRDGTAHSPNFRFKPIYCIDVGCSLFLASCVDEMVLIKIVHDYRFCCTLSFKYGLLVIGCW